jgi:hypothetical protein
MPACRAMRPEDVAEPPGTRRSVDVPMRLICMSPGSSVRTYSRNRIYLLIVRLLPDTILQNEYPLCRSGTQMPARM